MRCPQIAFVIDTDSPRKRVLWIGGREDVGRDWIFSRVIPSVQDNANALAVPFLKWSIGLEMGVFRQDHELRVWSTLTNWASKKLEGRVKPALASVSGFRLEPQSPGRRAKKRQRVHLYDHGRSLFDAFLKHTGCAVSAVNGGKAAKHVYLFRGTVIENSRLRELAEREAGCPVVEMADAALDLTDTCLDLFRMRKVEIGACIQEFCGTAGAGRTRTVCIKGRGLEGYTKRLMTYLEESVEQASRRTLSVEDVYDATLANDSGLTTSLKRFFGDVDDKVAVITGMTGQGKTTALRYLAWRACGRFLSKLDRRVSVFIEGGKDPVVAFAAALARFSGTEYRERDVRAALRSVPCLVFIDEAVFSADAQRVLRQMIVSSNRATRFIVSSRDCEDIALGKMGVWAIRNPENQALYLECNKVDKTTAKLIGKRVEAGMGHEILSVPFFLWAVSYGVRMGASCDDADSPVVWLRNILEGVFVEDMLQSQAAAKREMSMEDAGAVREALRVLCYRMVREGASCVGLTHEAIEDAFRVFLKQRRQRGKPGECAHRLFGMMVDEGCLVRTPGYKYRIWDSTVCNIFAAAHLVSGGAKGFNRRAIRAGYRKPGWYGTLIMVACLDDGTLVNTMLREACEVDLPMAAMLWNHSQRRPAFAENRITGLWRELIAKYPREALCHVFNVPNSLCALDSPEARRLADEWRHGESSLYLIDDDVEIIGFRRGETTNTTAKRKVGDARCFVPLEVYRCPANLAFRVGRRASMLTHGDPVFWLTYSAWTGSSSIEDLRCEFGRKLTDEETKELIHVRRIEFPSREYDEMQFQKALLWRFVERFERGRRRGSRRIAYGSIRHKEPHPDKA